MFSLRRWLPYSILGISRPSERSKTAPRKKNSKFRSDFDVLEDRLVPTLLYVDLTPTIGPSVLPNDDSFTPTQGNFSTVNGLQLGTNLFTSINDAVAVANNGDQILVADGTFDEDVALTDDNVKLLGTGAPFTTIVGQKGGDGATIRISANNLEIAGFTITRDGNTVADWNDPTLNSAGIAVQGLALSGMNVHDNIITGNRSGIDVNQSSNHTIHNNQIINNRTGLIFRNQTDNITLVENQITDNFTVGVLFLDGSGSGTPVQQALNSNFSNNNLSGNWYGQIVDRQSGGALPTPGTTNIKDFSGNWFGTASPAITTADSTEPGYAAQIPVQFGGNATAPGGQPDIAGPASANFDITPLLISGLDTDVETVPGRGTFGFQGDFSTLKVTTQGAQNGSLGRITEGVGLVTVNGTLQVTAGSFSEQLTIDKPGVKVVGQGVDVTTINYAGAFTGQGGVYITADRVEMHDLTVDGGAFPNVDSNPRYGIKIDFANNTPFGVDSAVIDNVKVTHSFRTGLDFNGVTNITVNRLQSIDNGGAGVFMTDVNGASLSNITTSGNPWAGVSVATLGQFFPIGTSGIVFSGTNSFGESSTPNSLGQLNGGLQFEMGNFANPSNPRLISWSTLASDHADVTILANDFGFAVGGSSDNSNRYLRFYKTLQQAKDAALGTADHLVAGTRYIQEADDSNGLPSSGPTQFYLFPNAVPPNNMSIQAAINAAVTGDFVNVANGTYTEAVLVNRNLTLNTEDGTVLSNLSLTASGATLFPGNGPASLTTANLALGFHSKTVFELGNGNVAGVTYDQINVIGDVNINSAANLSLSLLPGFTPVANTTYTLINKTTPGGISGTFAGLANGSTAILEGLSFKVNYGGGDGNDLTLTLVGNSAPVNQVPGTQTFTVTNGVLFSIANGNAIQISDVDAGSGNVTVNLQTTSGKLVIASGSGISFTGYNTNNLTLTGTVTNVNKALNALFFRPTGTGTFTLTVTTNDNGNSGGPALTDTDTVTLVVQTVASHVNLAPFINAPSGTQTVTPLAPFAFNDADGNAISVGDLDAGGAQVQVTLQAGFGRIKLGTTTGLTFVSGTTNNSSTVTVRGRLDYINFNLQNLTYTPNGNFPGSDTLSVQVNDLGNTGTGGAKTATDNITLVGTPLPPNVAPVNTVPGATQVVAPSQEILFSAANGNAVQVSDADAGNGTVTVNIKVNRGTLAFGLNSNVTLVGQNTANITISGTVANLNRTLNSLFYRAPSTAGAAILTITTNDNGNTGPGTALTDVDTVSINVANHANSAPTLTLPPSQNVAMGGSLAFNDANNNTILVGDKDSGFGNVTVTLSVANGTLSLASFVGASFVGNGTSTITLIGRVDHLNFSLQSLLYQNNNGTADTLMIGINDNGQKGTGGALTANGTIGITVV